MDSDEQQLVGKLAFTDDSHMETEVHVEQEEQGNSEQNNPSTLRRLIKNREELKDVLHCQKAQYVIVSLVVLDCLIVIAELILDLVIKVDHDHLAPHILHYISIAILSIFLIELVLKIYAMGLEYFKHKLEVFDGIVVVVSFALDIAFSNSTSSDAAGLIVILRLWRVTRIINGIIISVKMQAEHKIGVLTEEKEELQEELAKLKIRNQELETLIKSLKDQENGVS